MPTTLTIRDETVGGQKLREWEIDVLAERLSVRELIRSRVYQEVRDFNQVRPEAFQGLVQPTDAERTVNGFKVAKGRIVDWKSQFDKAIDAFLHSQIVILIGDRQVESLEEEIEVTPGTEVSFLRLVPLAGG